MDKVSNSNKKMKVSNERDLDCTNVARGVWLVKVPKYLSSRWKNAKPRSEAGRLRITKGTGGKNDIKFTVSDELLSNSTEPISIPNQHQFVISDIARQSLVVFSQNSETADSSSSTSDSNSNKLVLEGQVVLKGECRPQASQQYMKLKRESILKASQPERQLQQLQKLVPTFKPVSDHKHNIEFDQKKKAEGKKARDDKDKVQDMLYKAFEKHQYYNIKDLEKITKQPITYLKEILKEMCIYNVKNPHKSMWELKPEFRYYKDEEKPQDPDDES